MSTLELVLNMLAEAATTNYHKPIILKHLKKIVRLQNEAENMQGTHEKKLKQIQANR